MGRDALKKVLKNSAPIIALVILLFVSLYSISDATSNSASFEKYYTILVFFNSIGLITLLGLIFYNVFKLVTQYRLKAVGSRLTTRMIGIFVILTIVPVSVVYYFSLTFLHRSIDSWFDVGVEQALDDSLQLGRSAVDFRKKESLKKARAIASELPSVPDELRIVYLNDALNEYNASELTLVGRNGVILASSSENSAELPSALAKTIIGTLNEGDHYLNMEETPSSGELIRVVVPVQNLASIEQSYMLQTAFPISDNVTALAEGVEQAYEQYQELAVIRLPLKTSFTLALSVVWLLSVLSAILIAFIASRRLVSPINVLVEGTQAVAAGDYEKRLPVSGNDELGFLIRSFNTMTRKILRAREMADKSQLMEAVQRNYLESVLEHINSGVITIDSNKVIKHGNRSAELIFGVDQGSLLEKTITEIVESHPQLKHLFDIIESKMKKRKVWQEEINIFAQSGRKILHVKGTELNQQQDIREQVIVIDDLTELIQAQKDSAWSEMARRLAHEIKNPLTPIQLSAERLQKKISGQVDAEHQDLLDRYTYTIVQQVDAMKTMVNSFTEYARVPDPNPVSMKLNNMISEVVQLYHENEKNIEIMLQLDEKVPEMTADPVRLRQLIHNLIKNAVEAVNHDGWIRVKTECLAEHGCHFFELVVEDSGEGIDDKVIDTLFEPYETTKPSGSGLGLAIVKKIVDEHNGMVWVKNSHNHGACFYVRLPVLTAHET